LNIPIIYVKTGTSNADNKVLECMVKGNHAKENCKYKVKDSLVLNIINLPSSQLTHFLSPLLECSRGIQRFPETLVGLVVSGC